MSIFQATQSSARGSCLARSCVRKFPPKLVKLPDLPTPHRCTPPAAPHVSARTSSLLLAASLLPLGSLFGGLPLRNGIIPLLLPCHLIVVIRRQPPRASRIDLLFSFFPGSQCPHAHAVVLGFANILFCLFERVLHAIAREEGVLPRLQSVVHLNVLLSVVSCHMSTRECVFFDRCDYLVSERGIHAKILPR